MGCSACKTYLNSVSNINGFDSCDFIISFCFKFVSPSKFAVSTKQTFCLSLDSNSRISAGIISFSCKRTISPGLLSDTISYQRIAYFGGAVLSTCLEIHPSMAGIVHGSLLSELTCIRGDGETFSEMKIFRKLFLQLKKIKI